MEASPKNYIAIASISVTKLAEVVLLTQMSGQFVRIKIAAIAELAQRMASIRLIIFITNTSVLAQILSRVKLPLRRK
jgi:hypothetical protein